MAWLQPEEQPQSQLVGSAASIITVNTNERHRLEVYLPSVFASRGDFEVIISDNGSTDGSLESVAEQFPAVRVVRNGGNIGFAAANNSAARISEREILVFINPDTSVHPDWLNHLLQPFADPHVGLTTSKILLMSDPEKINACGNTMHLTGLTQCRGIGASSNLYEDLEEVDAVSGAGFAIRRELFEILGGFDEDFFIYMEETDVSLRARLNGWKCIYAPRSVILHDYELRFGPNKVLYQERNRYLMLLKTLKWPTLLTLLPAYFLAEVITWGFVISSDRAHWRNKFRAYRSIMTHWPAILNKRKETQQLRKVTDRELLRGVDYRLNFGQVATGSVAILADWIFTPMFFVLRTMTRLVFW